MNADGRRTEDALELLSAPAEWDLPPGRHLHYKDVLMQQIDQDLGHAPAAAPVSAPAPAPRRRLTRPAFLVPLASTVLAGALALTLTGTGGSPAPAPADRAATGSAHAQSASLTLHRIAVAAMASDVTPVRDDQFVYVRNLTVSNKGTFEGPVKLGAPHTVETWTSQDPRPRKTLGWIRESGKDAVMPDETIPIESTDAVPAGIDHPTYTWLSSLPTDPDALLALLRRDVRVSDGESREQAVFSLIGDLLSQTLMPPRNTAALYKAAARIPGVKEIPDAVDVAGRHGIAITREDASSATRDEWIFDKRSLAFLGARGFITHDKQKGITTDTLMGSTAVLQRAVVDRHGEESAGADS
ncbi:CU044_5270 family protein [Streptomyces sp. NBC_00151]|uniref:CU044_5270 family protein n=1 Tax=Streptomyces sp. NBC_00151 TaxID=2975669 RepID=UPI002DDA1193|nr:CU044_5270 family protein [Streptomyces sp. NBC_00151]WRZ44400.1 CU044_5270 family protein [Streptomyces sp. NBC_00151]